MTVADSTEIDDTTLLSEVKNTGSQSAQGPTSNRRAVGREPAKHPTKSYQKSVSHFRAAPSLSGALSQPGTYYHDDQVWANIVDPYHP